MEIDWSLIVQVAGIFLALIGGVLAVPLVNLIKNAARIDGRLAQLVTAVVAALIAVLTMIVSGAISPEPLTVEYIGSLFTAVLVASQAEYQRLMRQAETE